jgi:hypothetical protein
LLPSFRESSVVELGVDDGELFVLMLANQGATRRFSP